MMYLPLIYDEPCLFGNRSTKALQRGQWTVNTFRLLRREVDFAQHNLFIFNLHREKNQQ